MSYDWTVAELRDFSAVSLTDYLNDPAQELRWLVVDVALDEVETRLHAGHYQCSRNELERIRDTLALKASVLHRATEKN